MRLAAWKNREKAERQWCVKAERVKCKTLLAAARRGKDYFKGSKRKIIKQNEIQDDALL